MEHPKAIFIKTKMKGIQIYSCYARPGTTFVENKQILSVLMLDTRGLALKIIAANFNARDLKQSNDG